MDDAHAAGFEQSRDLAQVPVDQARFVVHEHIEGGDVIEARLGQRWRGEAIGVVAHPSGVTGEPRAELAEHCRRGLGDVQGDGSRSEQGGEPSTAGPDFQSGSSYRGQIWIEQTLGEIGRKVGEGFRR